MVASRCILGVAATAGWRAFGRKNTTPVSDLLLTLDLGHCDKNRTFGHDGVDALVDGHDSVGVSSSPIETSASKVSSLVAERASSKPASSLTSLGEPGSDPQIPVHVVTQLPPLVGAQEHLDHHVCTFPNRSIRAPSVSTSPSSASVPLTALSSPVTGTASRCWVSRPGGLRPVLSQPFPLDLGYGAQVRVLGDDRVDPVVDRHRRVDRIPWIQAVLLLHQR